MHPINCFLKQLSFDERLKKHELLFVKLLRLKGFNRDANMINGTVKATIYVRFPMEGKSENIKL